jgi:hypothetical protein
MRYLRYNVISNNFDSASVFVMVGEFAIQNGQSSVKLPLSIIQDGIVLSGDSTNGRDNTLASVARTKVFTIPSSGTVTFFRELGVTNNPCANNSEDPPSGPNRHWLMGVGRIPERTEFILELVDASNNIAYGTLDSVGVLPNPSTNYVIRYGTYPDKMNHTRTLPNGHTGDSAYIRIVPIRDSVTPSGMLIRQVYTWANMSAIREYSDSSLVKIQPSLNDSTQHLYWLDIKKYYDSVYTQTGHLPIRLVREVPHGYENEYHTRYSDTVTISGDTVWYKDKSPSGAKRARYDITRDSTISIDALKQNANISIVLSGRGSTIGQFRVMIRSGFVFENCNLVLFSLEGRRVKTVPIRRTTRIEYDLDIERGSELPSGKYFIALIDALNRVAGVGQVTLE